MWSRTLGFAVCAFPLLLGCSKATPPEREVLVQIEQVRVDPRNGVPVLLLEESDGHRALPIWIGINEARSIAAEIEEIESPRPNTHDLAKQMLDELDADIDRVVVTDLRDGTYYARVILRTSSGDREIDSRPSDAIALALRSGARVFVLEHLLDENNDVPKAEGEQRI